MFSLKRNFKTLLLLILFLAANLLVYTNKMPLYHEEPRRTIIANEMLLRGSYIVPTVCYETYFKKPPLQNWIILFLGKITGKITNFDARLPSVLSFLLTGFFLFFLFDDRKQGFIASLIFLTSYVTLISYANKAEPDILFTSLIFLSYYFWQKSKSLSFFIISSIFMGLAMLTKGISPIFFYPGLVLFYAFKRDNFSKNFLKLVFHFVLSLIFPILWLFLFAEKANLNSLLLVFSNEVSSRMVGSFSFVVLHLITFPLRAFLALFPWSIVFIFIFDKKLTKELKENELFMTSFLIFITSFLIMTVFPGGKGRYFMPAAPFFAITLSFLCPKGYLLKDSIKWFSILFLSAIYFIFSFYVIKHGFVFQGIVLIILGVLLLLFLRFKYYVFDFLVVFSMFLFLFYIHGLYLYRANTKKNYKQIAYRIYTLFPDKRLPVVVDNTLKPEFVSLALNLERITGEFVYSENVIKPNDFYLITSKDKVCKCCKKIFLCNCSSNVPTLYVYHCKKRE
ncbi:ArnT family glycosyltransferase [Thermotomaculum hydrothermale]|nr:glycosyltransferase family 39 protein [Thermotomaculum hydrothermale]